MDPLTMALISAGLTYGTGQLSKSKQKYPEIDIGKAEQTLDFDTMFATPYLKDLVMRRLGQSPEMGGPIGLGFGKEFVEKQTNPVIKQMEARQREVTEPKISSELSKRGMARSIGPGLASDVITRTQQATERDINELLAKFELLNQEQMKKDVEFAGGVSENMNALQSQMRMARAGLYTDVPLKQAQIQAMSDANANISQAAGAGGMADLLESLNGDDETIEELLRKILKTGTEEGSPDANLSGAKDEELDEQLRKKSVVWRQ